MRWAKHDGLHKGWRKGWLKGLRKVWFDDPGSDGENPLPPVPEPGSATLLACGLRASHCCAAACAPRTRPRAGGAAVIASSRATDPFGTVRNP